MGAACLQDLRDKVLHAYDRGMKTRQIAQAFDVSPSWLRRVAQRRRELNEISPRPMGGKRFEKIDRVRLAQLVAQRPDATLAICAADFNCSGDLAVQDIFDFLAAWFANSLTADFNGPGVISVQDIFDHLAAYFAGCN